MTFPQNPLDSVDELHRLDTALEYGKERALGTLVRRILARREINVGRDSGKPLAALGVEAPKILTAPISSAVTMVGTVPPSHRSSRGTH